MIQTEPNDELNPTSKGESTSADQATVGWKKTGQTISETVQNLLAIMVSEDRESLSKGTVRQVYSKKLRELAKHLGVSEPYMPRKILSGTWDADDLDKLADFFGTWPIEFVPGPHDEEKTE
ncbi:hypothetical protein [Streptomyces cucumeris]|uniref:hypothetical protein n=1 Tax=Streptomyces cucumeris TaxID=2962890 RepID=UPI0020C8AAAF|nr:hypothetical protein [Streptomyces sp. NEAU-Y11]MCP9209694.1 hypothetical protein [Streptomyces sp. NEAU-Y11]